MKLTHLPKLITVRTIPIVKQQNKKINNIFLFEYIKEKYISMFNKFLGYFKYRKIINENLPILTQRYKFRYDKVYGRLYTVLSIDQEKQEVLKTYGYEYLDNEVKKYIAAIEQYFSAIGMIDLVSISRIDSLDAVNVLMVFRYKYKRHQTILYVLFGLIGLILSVAAVTGLVKLIMILINFILAL